MGKGSLSGGRGSSKVVSTVNTGRVRNGMEDSKKRVLRGNKDPAQFLCCFPFLGFLLPLVDFCYGCPLGLPGLLFFL